MCVCVRACVRACMRACVRVCERERVREREKKIQNVRVIERIDGRTHSIPFILGHNKGFKSNVISRQKTTITCYLLYKHVTLIKVAP